MENETGKASFLGVTLVAIVAVVALALAVFAIARGVMNNGTTQYVKQMEKANTAGLSDYDGTTVSGVKVRSALEDYEGTDYALLVNTAAIQRIANPKAEAAAVEGKDFVKNWKKNLVTKENYGDDKNKDLQTTSFAHRAYVIYNAQLNGGDDKFTDSQEGFIRFSGTFKSVDGMIVYNVNKVNWKTSGCSEYISNTSSYNCKLIKDASDTIIGILFTEVY